MFGSDRPVCTPAASYAAVVHRAGLSTAGLGDDERHRICEETATRVYRL
jgi:L-fuconolactonase